MFKTALFVLMFGALYGKAEASTDVNIVLSSPTYSGVQVTTGTTKRVDRYTHGSSTATVYGTRIGVEIQNQDATYDVWCAYDADFSTTTVAADRGNDLGYRISAGGTRYMGALRTVEVHCQAAEGAGVVGVWVHTETVNKE